MNTVTHRLAVNQHWYDDHVLNKPFVAACHVFSNVLFHAAFVNKFLLIMVVHLVHSYNIEITVIKSYTIWLINIQNIKIQATSLRNNNKLSQTMLNKT